jgi:hypothetical protein
VPQSLARLWQEKRSPQIFIISISSPIHPGQRRMQNDGGRYLNSGTNFPKKACGGSIEGKAQFEKLARNHLTNYIRSHTNSSVVETN